MRANRGIFALFFSTAVVAVFVDQFTKLIAEEMLVPGRPVSAIGDLLSWTLVYNDSAAFSLGFGYTWILTIIASVAVALLLWFGPRAQTKLWGIIAGLVLGGATGNLIDRLIREPSFANGHVVDFIQIPLNFPIFNFADIFLITGICLAMLRTLLGDEIGGRHRN